MEAKRRAKHAGYTPQSMSYSAALQASPGYSPHGHGYNWSPQQGVSPQQGRSYSPSYGNRSMEYVQESTRVQRRSSPLVQTPVQIARPDWRREREKHEKQVVTSSPGSAADRDLSPVTGLQRRYTYVPFVF